MGQYITLTIKSNVYQNIIDGLMEYCSNLNEYFEIEEAVHLIDALEDERMEDSAKRQKEFEKYQEYQKLFIEYRNGKVGKEELLKYRDFNRINDIIEKTMEDGAITFLDEKQRFMFIMDILDKLKEDK